MKLNCTVFMLSSRRCLLLCFAFRSVIHFELIFVKDVRSVSIFVYGQHHLLKALFFIGLPLLLCQRSVASIYVGPFLSSILFH